MTGKRLRLSEDKCKLLGITYKGRDKHGGNYKVYVTEEQIKLLKLSDSSAPVIESSTEYKELEEGLSINYVGGEKINTKEKAIKYFEIDTIVYDVCDFSYKSWTTTMKIKGKDGTQTPTQVINYAVSFKAKKKALEFEWSNIKVKPRVIKKASGKGSILVPLSDFHVGADISGLLRTKDFNFNILSGYLEQIADDINDMGKENVHLMLLGDFIESFTGLNHINSWKGISKNSYGMNAVILTHELLSKYLYTNIKNLKSVDFCSGNHDRVSSDKGLDQSGEVASMLYYIFKKEFKEIEGTFSDLIVSRKIDRIGYLGSHGHLGLSKKDTGKIIHDYGFDKKEVDYHIVIQGHEHTRSVKKEYRKKIAKYEDVESIIHDSLDYRRVKLPPLFTGNYYSESLGFTSSVGFNMFHVDKKGRLRHEDIML